MSLRDKYSHAILTAKNLGMEGSAEERDGNDPDKIQPGQVLKMPAR